MNMAMTRKELTERAVNLPAVPNWEKNTHWGKYRDAMRDHFIVNDSTDLLCWSTISATMFVGEFEVTRAELVLLKESPRWEYYAKTALMEDDFGSPPRMSGQSYTSGNLIHQLFHLMQWEKATGMYIENAGSIIEFGGGYGAMCAIVRRMGFVGKYYLVDLPEMSLLQEYYLTNLGFDAEYIPCDWGTDFRDCAPKTADVVIALHSLSETPVPTRDNFFDAITPVSWLISYQSRFFNFDNIGWIDLLKDTHKGYEHKDIINPINSNIHYLVSYMKGRLDV